MNAVEEIQAAIDKLIGLKAASRQPVPDADFPELAGWYVDTDGNKGYGIFALRGYAETAWPVMLYGNRADADLIVTLHRTLDAQLALLRNGLVGARMNESVGMQTTGPILALARAITGGA
jgi:hypothetical protein